MPYSSTYIAIAALTYFGVENAVEVVNAAVVIFVALVAFYGRYRAGGISWFGLRK